uniref:Uncharacterized protein n=1 Tax=Arundo donax TaxID=35708 RepID=A0A0A9AJS8_ARUDO
MHYSWCQLKSIVLLRLDGTQLQASTSPFFFTNHGYAEYQVIVPTGDNEDV